MGIVHRLFPDFDPTPLDESALATLYTPDPGRSGVRANFVTSLDGAVTVDGYSEGLSGPADKLVFGLLRMQCDALLVGAGTLRNEGYGPMRLDDRRRRWRREHGRSEYPTLVVVSAALALDPASRPFAEAPVRPIVLTCAASPGPARAALAAVADIIVCGDTVVDFAAGLAALRERDLAQVLCEGGPQVLGALTAADLVDELCLTVSPLLAGAGAGRITAGRSSPAVRRLALRHALLDGDMLLLRYARPR